MKRQKFYAVKNGREIGVFSNWDDCKKSVHGFTGAIYKSFTVKEDAENYIKQDQDSTKRLAHNEIDKCKTKYAAYVDGSYNLSTKFYGSGIVIVDVEKDEVVEEIYFGKEDKVNMRNVTGECVAALTALTYANKNNLKEISLFFDYQGIQSWVLGEWKAKNDFTKWYVEKYTKFAKDLTVHFFKVKGHIGDKYNEMADVLSKKGCGVL
jgi:ribonuclease HI